MRLKAKWTESSEINFEIIFLTLSLEIFHFYLGKGLWTHLTQFCVCQRHGPPTWHASCHLHTVSRWVFSCRADPPRGLLYLRVLLKQSARSCLFLTWELLCSLRTTTMTLPPAESSSPHSTPSPPQIPSKYSLTVYTSRLIWPLSLRERTQVRSFSAACRSSIPRTSWGDGLQERAF